MCVKMESNFEENLKILREKFKNEDKVFDSVDMENCLREFKTELYIKRDQVKQLRADLELSTAEVMELKSALDSTTKSLEEKTFNLNVITKKFKNTEEELLEKVEAFNKIQMQYKSLVAEVETMKEYLQKNESEKLQLSRKLEVFQAKQRQSFIYHNQILKRETNLKSTIEEVEEMVKKLQLELGGVNELSSKTKLAEESLEKYQHLTRTYEKVKKERDNFEELYIKVNAKYEMLEQLLSLNEVIQKPNLMTKIVFNQWKASRNHYEEQVETTNKILNKLTDCYNNEKKTNIQLIKVNEGLSDENQKLNTEIENLKSLNETIEKLQQKIIELEKTKGSNDVEQVKVKNEPIEIED